MEEGININRPPMGNHIVRVRDQWRHVTMKGQGRDPNAEL